MMSFVTVFKYILGLAKRRSLSFVNFVTALAYHFCLALAATFTQPGGHFLAKPCIHGSVLATSIVVAFVRSGSP